MDKAFSTDEQFMQRCIQLASLAKGKVAPNPVVGAVLVHQGRIIGEGFHQRFGEAHAEVNCINSVMKEDVPLIKDSALYVSLEPCAHFGKTPPCSSLIIEKEIKKVVIGCRDSFKEVSGKGIAQLKEAGIEVITGVLEKECIELNRYFFCFHEMKRPYIILKWAQSANSKIGADDEKRILISNEYSNRLVHQWRSEIAAILVGTQTAIKDNPSLTTRLWKGKNPVRIIIDKNLQLPASSNVFSGEADTIVFNKIKNEQLGHCIFITIQEDDFLNQILVELYQRNIQSLLVEGGSKTLQAFIDAGLWDEARVITNTHLNIEKGTAAPQLTQAVLQHQEIIFNDLINWYKRNDT